MKLMSWNVRFGGGPRVPDILDSIESHAPDVAVIVEYDGSESAELDDGLAALGLNHQHPADEDRETARVLIASGPQLIPVEPSAPELQMPERWAEVVIPSHGVRLAGVYVPVTGKRPERKRRMWEAVRAAAARRIEESYVVVGDWNTGDHPMDKTHPGRPFRFTDEYRKLLAGDYVEAWRHANPDAQEYSWYGRGRGFRIDHAFLSPPALDRLTGCRYSHEEREAGVSDHSILIVDVASADRPEGP